MSLKKVIFFLCIALAFTSCKTYEVMRYKGNELDKVKDVNSHTVYIHAAKATYLVAKPSLGPAGITGDVSPVKDAKEAEDIKNPANLKKHKHDLNLFAKGPLADSTGTITLKKGDINEYSLVITHSHVNWEKIGDIFADIFGTAVCLATLGALVYWFTLF